MLAGVVWKHGFASSRIFTFLHAQPCTLNMKVDYYLLIIVNIYC